MATTMQAAIHLGPNYIENLEVCRNTNFRGTPEYLPYHSEVCIASSSWDSE